MYFKRNRKQRIFRPLFTHSTMSITIPGNDTTSEYLPFEHKFIYRVPVSNHWVMGARAQEQIRFVGKYNQRTAETWTHDVYEELKMRTITFTYMYIHIWKQSGIITTIELSHVCANNSDMINTPRNLKPITISIIRFLFDFNTI